MWSTYFYVPLQMAELLEKRNGKEVVKTKEGCFYFAGTKIAYPRFLQQIR